MSQMIKTRFFFIQKGITLIFELENLFKVTAQPLPKDYSLGEL